MQLLAVVIPKLEAWQKEGEIGIKKITQWTRYLTVALAILQSTGLAFLFHRGGLQNAQGQPVDLIKHFTPPRVALIVITLTAGTALIMWFGELITTRGIGNGMSILIFTAIVAKLPSEGAAILQQKGLGWFSLVLLLGIAVIVAIVIVEQGQRRIPVQYAKRVVGRKLYGGSSTYIPLKVNQAGVIPIIFASSVLYFPALVSTIIPWQGFRNFLSNNVVKQDSPIHILLYGVELEDVRARRHGDVEPHLHVRGLPGRELARQLAAEAVPRHELTLRRAPMVREMDGVLAIDRPREG